jgi:hypothetical protein
VIDILLARRLIASRFLFWLHRIQQLLYVGGKSFRLLHPASMRWDRVRRWIGRIVKAIKELVERSNLIKLGRRILRPLE